MPDAIDSSTQTVSTLSQQDVLTLQQARRSAKDWVRLMRFNPEVNKSTIGVLTDRVTPELMLGTSASLLRISRGEEEPSAKDSLAYQRFYGPAEYFAEHIQRDQGKLARSILWKATNKGNLDFIGSNMLEPHISSVFYDSNLAQYLDGTTPFLAVDLTFKTTRVGLGGIASADNAPDEMRTVQPSYYGFVDPVRSPLRGQVGLSGYMTKNVLKGSDGKLYQRFINARTGELELVDSVTAANSVISSHDVMEKNTRSVFAHGGKTGVRIVNRLDVDYYLPRPDDAYSTGSNMVTMLDGIKLMRLLMGCVHPMTPMITLDHQGMVHITSARNIADNKPVLYSCTPLGLDSFVICDKVLTRLTTGQKYFYKVVMSSGRVLITSPEHKWVTLGKQNKIKMLKATAVKPGMRVPRKLFIRTPVQNTDINGVPVTKDVAVLLGRIQRTMHKTDTGYRIQFLQQQRSDIKSALDKLCAVPSYFTVYKGTPCVHIKDPDLLSWILSNIGTLRETHKVPACILSADTLLVALYLDSYSKLVDNVGMDGNGDIWLMDLDNLLLRTAMAFLLSRIGTDTVFRDIKTRKGTLLALKLIPALPTFGDCVVDTVVAVVKIPAPGYMIDFDADDNVYAVGHGVITHNSKYATQAVPLLLGLVPLVQSIDRYSGKTIESLVGRKLGARFALKPGVVTAVRLDRVDVVYDDGQKGSIDLYKNFPANIKGYLSNRVLVKAGDRFGKDQIIAASNFTDDNGVQAMGRNLRVGYISYKGGTYEDACVLSESAAKKLSSRTMYKTNVDLNSTIRTGKNTYTMWKPQQYKNEALLKLDDDGVVKVGQVLHKGDPMVLAVQVTEPSPGTMGKRLLTDKCLEWEHAHPGVVTDVVKTRKGIKVYATVDAPVLVGDKLSGRYGNKATAAMILPDDQMPRDSKGRPLDMLMSPLGIVSRCYDKDTLFLTRSGWKNGADVLRLDLLYAYDPNTGMGLWSKQLLPMYSYKHTGILYSASNANIDLRVTKNHTVVYRLTQDSPYIRATAQLIFGKDVYMPTISSITELCSDILVRSTDWRIILGYDDRVYCPTVTTGFVLVRRNGKCVYAGNTNPSQLIETQLGKIALKLGHPIEVNQFLPLDKILMVKRLSKLHNVPMSLDVYDPDSGRTLKGILTGRQYVYKLKHMALSKMSARGTATYNALGVPAAGGLLGSKRFGGLLSIGLIGHGAFDALVTDAKLIRGQSNAEFWRKIRVGQIPTIPGLPLVHKKFFAHLQGSGMRIRKTSLGISIFALTNSDVKLIAGNRLVKTRDTYLSKSFQPMDGGLFGTDIFGLDGTRWGYIQLDLPMLNPVMEQPVARLLQIPLKKLLAILRGQLLFQGKKGPLAIADALQKVDILNLSKKALAELKAASKSKKDAALKRYVAILRMRRVGVHPSEFMLLRIPVIPPQFRPITSHNGLTMVADSNYLYAQLIDARDDMRAAQNLPDEYKDKARSMIYTKWKLLVGLYEPLDRKLKLKSVKGLLKWALGEPAKYGAFQRKVFGSIVDTVGRGVVLPNSRLKLNLVGLPLDMAWNVFAPFVTRALVQAGYSTVDALKATKSHSPVAKLYLLKAMLERPVIMNRAPSLHKLSLMGLKPKLVTGHAIHVHPSIVVPFGMDFDGNCCDFDSEIFVKILKSTLDKYSDVCYNIGKPKNLLEVFMHTDKNSEVMVKDGHVYATIKIGEFPRVGLPVKDRNGADVFQVPPGISVASCDPVTGAAIFSPVTGYTVESDCSTVKVTLGSREIIVSDNESMACFDQATGELVKVRPADVGARSVPVLRKNPMPFGTAGDRDIGWLIGSILSDGWVSLGYVGYAKQEACKRDAVVSIMRRYHDNFTVHTYTGKSAGSSYKYGDSVKVHMSSRTLVDWWNKLGIYCDDPDILGAQPGTLSSALLKYINPAILEQGSEEMLWGLLSGMLDGDGSIVKNTVKAKPQYTFRFATSSKALKKSVCDLCYRLGIRFSVTTTPPRGTSGEAYTVVLSSVDMYANIDKLTCIGASEVAILNEFKAAGVAPDKKDSIPVSDSEWVQLKDYVRTVEGTVGVYAACTSTKSGRRICSRYALLKHSDWLREHIPSLYARVVAYDTVWMQVKSIEDAGTRQVFDLLVADTKVFAINQGVIIWDTVNIHAPVSRGAVRDIKDKMMPLRNLISMANRTILYKPLKEYIQGLYLATRAKDKPVKRFATLAEARLAYKQGTLDVDDPILIG